MGVCKGRWRAAKRPWWVEFGRVRVWDLLRSGGGIESLCSDGEDVVAV